jgi:asparagine synthase (glutamine-hydrolysing)
MCGIAGFIDFNRQLDLSALQKMRQCVAHRGPDAANEVFEAEAGFNIGLGHTRLSIIDLSDSANQPFYFNQYILVFNGEIYNYKEIRQRLQQLGRVFHTDSDTEVLIQAFDEWHTDAVKQFIGMFAFAIYDKEKSKVYLCRDRVNVKPLFYYYRDNVFLFGSELKPFYSVPSFKKEIDTDAVAEFLQIGYIKAPRTVFHKCHKLEGGNFLCIDLLRQELSTINYWSPDHFYQQPALDISRDEARAELKKLCESAFNYRMVADVPVGVFLSGGYDSSLVTSVLQTGNSQKIKTITIGFKEDEFNEANYAREVAKYLGTEHIEEYCTEKEALEIVPLLPFIYDEPFGDSSAIPTYLVSRVAKRHVKVVLSADGGDELFAGYIDYGLNLKRYAYNQKFPSWVRKPLGAALGAVRPLIAGNLLARDNRSTRYDKLQEILKADTLYEIADIFARSSSDRETRRLLRNKKIVPFATDDASYRDELSALLIRDLKSYLADDILVKVDRATMYAGIEGRDPFLDHRVIEFAASLPSEYKYDNGKNKIILKELVHEYLPKQLMDRPKMGFAIPLRKWLKGELKVFVEKYLSADYLKAQGFFDEKEVEKLIGKFYAGQQVNERKLWYLLVFQLWYSRWIDNQPIESIG